MSKLKKLQKELKTVKKEIKTLKKYVKETSYSSCGGNLDIGVIHSKKLIKRLEKLKKDLKSKIKDLKTTENKEEIILSTHYVSCGGSSYGSCG